MGIKIIDEEAFLALFEIKKTPPRDQGLLF